MLYETQLAKAQADAMSGGPTSQPVFQSNEIGKFGPTPEELRDGYRYNGEIG
jgi:hypothetical protein